MTTTTYTVTRSGLIDFAAERYEDLPTELRRGYPQYLTIHEPLNVMVRWILCPKQGVIIENLSAIGTKGEIRL